MDSFSDDTNEVTGFIHVKQVRGMCCSKYLLFEHVDTKVLSLRNIRFNVDTIV